MVLKLNKHPDVLARWYFVMHWDFFWNRVKTRILDLFRFWTWECDRKTGHTNKCTYLNFSIHQWRAIIGGRGKDYAFSSLFVNNFSTICDISKINYHAFVDVCCGQINIVKIEHPVQCSIHLYGCCTTIKRTVFREEKDDVGERIKINTPFLKRIKS